MKRLLVVRFSAMGDVAMTVPVLYSLATQYPELEITVLSRANFRPLFEKLPENVTYRAADLRGKHKGILAQCIADPLFADLLLALREKNGFYTKRTERKKTTGTIGK